MDFCQGHTKKKSGTEISSQKKKGLWSLNYPRMCSDDIEMSASRYQKEETCFEMNFYLERKHIINPQSTELFFLNVTICLLGSTFVMIPEFHLFVNLNSERMNFFCYFHFTVFLFKLENTFKTRSIQYICLLCFNLSDVDKWFLARSCCATHLIIIEF